MKKGKTLLEDLALSSVISSLCSYPMHDQTKSYDGRSYLWDGA